MKEKESEHMNVLGDQFAQLNYAISTHVLNGKENIPMTTTISLGSKEMPYLMSVRAYGKLSILQDDLIISINGTPNKNITVGTIEYSSYNNYFIDQNFIFESGGMILSQQSGNVMKIKPGFSALFLDDFLIDFTIVNISTIGNKDRSYVGFGPTSIQTEYIKSPDPSSIDNVSYINITTKYPYAWYNFLNTTLINAGFTYDPDPADADDKNYTIEIIDNNVSIHFLDFPENDRVILHITESKIGAQIAPGVIEERK